jgi:hypothetical protein
MTSIDYLFTELWETSKDKFTWHSILEKAKEMHKQEIINAYFQCGKDNFDHIKVINKSATDYYQETFVSKGTYVNGDIVTKDSVINELPTTTSDLIDSTIWSLPFEERMKCWDLIEKLVEEEKSTLYTEEQVMEAFDAGYGIRGAYGDRNDNMTSEQYIQSLKPKKD